MKTEEIIEFKEELIKTELKDFLNGTFIDSLAQLNLVIRDILTIINPAKKSLILN